MQMTEHSDQEQPRGKRKKGKRTSSRPTAWKDTPRKKSFGILGNGLRENVSEKEDFTMSRIQINKNRLRTKKPKKGRQFPFIWDGSVRANRIEVKIKGECEEALTGPRPGS